MGNLLWSISNKDKFKYFLIAVCISRGYRKIMLKSNLVNATINSSGFLYPLTALSWLSSL